MSLEQVISSIPTPVQHSVNWTAALTGLAAILTPWVNLGLGLLSGFWIACQVWLFFKNKPWRKKS